MWMYFINMQAGRVYANVSTKVLKVEVSFIVFLQHNTFLINPVPGESW